MAFATVAIAWTTCATVLTWKLLQKDQQEQQQRQQGVVTDPESQHIGGFWKPNPIKGEESKTGELEMLDCVICHSNKPCDVVLEKCGHVMCKECCVRQHPKVAASCPVCRANCADGSQYLYCTVKEANRKRIPIVVPRCVVLQLDTSGEMWTLRKLSGVVLLEGPAGIIGQEKAWIDQQFPEILIKYTTDTHDEPLYATFHFMKGEDPICKKNGTIFGSSSIERVQFLERGKSPKGPLP